MVYLLPTRLGDMLWEDEKCHGNNHLILEKQSCDPRRKREANSYWGLEKIERTGALIWVKSTQVGSACEGGKENAQQWGARRGDGSKGQNSSKWKEKSVQRKPQEKGVERT